MQQDYKKMYDDLCQSIKNLSDKIDSNRDIVDPMLNLEYISKHIKPLSENKKGEWKLYSMYDLIDLRNENVKGVFKKAIVEIKLPTKRWGEITTEYASSDKKSIDAGIAILTERGYKVRRKIDKELSEKHKNYRKKLYNIEIFITSE